ncbi:MAG: hypothetical protein HUU34_12370 [Saprospiraceae bacterium]|jgi:hypothetical protein|nr:hypothetical protein [Saprospiraceae bacterium]
METKISKAQLSVWEWKEKAYEDIKHLPILEQMRIIHERTQQVINKININKAKNSALPPTPA